MGNLAGNVILDREMIVHATRLPFLCAIGCVASSLLAASQVPAAKLTIAQPPAVRLVGRVLQSDGTLLDGASVVVRGGHIAYVGTEADGESVPVRVLPSGSVISPGLIDLFALPSAVGQTVEDAKSLDPQASPAGSLDPTHSEFRAALEAGITAVTVAPSAVNLVCGVCVTTRTYLPDGQLDLLRDNGPLMLAYGEGVWRLDRKPTSRAGAAHELRELLVRASEGATDARLCAVARGELDAWIACGSGEDAREVRGILGDHGRSFGAVITQDALELAAPLADLRGPVVLGPYSMAAEERELRGPATLANAGIEVALRAGFPVTAPDALRITAALATRHGLEPAAARRAITIAPAKVAGIDRRLGSIAPGKDGDLVVFSDDPLRLDARVLEVYVQGRCVYCAPSRHAKLTGGQP